MNFCFLSMIEILLAIPVIMMVIAKIIDMFNKTAVKIPKEPLSGIVDGRGKSIQPLNPSEDMYIITIYFNRRIISVVPSHTETLCDLGLQSCIKGVTKYCIEPSSIKDQAV